MKHIIASVSLGALLVMGAGCLSTSTGGMEVAFREGGSANVRIDDGFFRQHLEVDETISNRTEFGFMTASVLVRNKLNKDFPIQYKFVWFDENGLEVLVGGRAWEQTTIHGGELISLQATAPDTSVVKYIVRMRRAK